MEHGGIDGKTGTKEKTGIEHLPQERQIHIPVHPQPRKKENPQLPPLSFSLCHSYWISRQYLFPDPDCWTVSLDRLTPGKISENAISSERSPGGNERLWIDLASS